MRIGKFLQRAAVLALATSLLLAGCQNETPVPASSEEEGLLVGFSMATLKEDRWLRDRDIFSAKAKQEGINVLISNANNDAERQYEQVVDMVGKSRLKPKRGCRIGGGKPLFRLPRTYFGKKGTRSMQWSLQTIHSLGRQSMLFPMRG